MTKKKDYVTMEEFEEETHSLDMGIVVAVLLSFGLFCLSLTIIQVNIPLQGKEFYCAQNETNIVLIKEDVGYVTTCFLKSVCMCIKHGEYANSPCLQEDCSAGTDIYQGEHGWFMLYKDETCPTYMKTVKTDIPAKITNRCLDWRIRDKP